MVDEADSGEGPLLGRQAEENDGWLDEKQLLPELVAHLRQHRSQLRQEWAGRITDATC
jgi:rsbT co-antagonist protein RsbR